MVFFIGDSIESEWIFIGDFNGNIGSSQGKSTNAY